MVCAARIAVAVALAQGVACTAVPRTCSKEQVDQIASFTEGLRAAVERSALPDPGVALPALRGGGAALEEGIVVALDAEGLRVGGDRADGRWSESALLEEALVRQAAIAEVRGAPALTRMIAAIAADVPAREVVELLALAARAGVTEVQVVAEDADAPAIPAIPRPEVAAELRAQAAGDEASLHERLALALDEEVPRCPPLGEPVGTLFPLSAPRTATLTAEALRGCGCAADVDRVLTLLHLRIAPRGVTIVSRPLTLDLEGDARIVAAADQPWSELAPFAFEAGRRGFGVVVR